MKVAADAVSRGLWAGVRFAGDKVRNLRAMVPVLPGFPNEVVKMDIL